MYRQLLLLEIVLNAHTQDLDMSTMLNHFWSFFVLPGAKFSDLLDLILVHSLEFHEVGMFVFWPYVVRFIKEIWCLNLFAVETRCIVLSLRNIFQIIYAKSVKIDLLAFENIGGVRPAVWENSGDVDAPVDDDEVSSI